MDETTTNGTPVEGVEVSQVSTSSDPILDAVKELTSQVAEMAKQLKEFKERYEMDQRKGKF